MSDWSLAPTLRVLRSEINSRYPGRDKTSDGTLGNASHAAGTSDHNPDSRGVVCAIDIDEDLLIPAGPYPSFHTGKAAAPLVAELIANAKAGKTPQLYYVIYEGKIISRTYDWRVRDYDGPSLHDHHFHVSVYHTPVLADRTNPWGVDVPSAKEIADELAGNRKFLAAVGEAVWEADIIPNVWGDAKTNPNAKAKNGVAEIGRDANAIRDKLQA